MPKKKKSKKKPVKKDKEKVCEVFEVEKKGKESVKKACDSMETKHATKKELENQNKTLRNILIGIGLFVVLLILIVYMFQLGGRFEYRGVTFEVIKEGNLLFYKTAFPVKYAGDIVTYQVFIRNDPRTLERDIPFEGEMDFGAKFTNIDGLHRLVVNASDTFDCAGYEIIAIGNMANLKAVGITMVKDENATCDEQGRYMFINIKKGDESKITQIGDSCYELSVKDCEIMEVTERFMTEAFVYHQEKIKDII
jgi:hypothetical protein